MALGKKTEQAAESKPLIRVHGLTPVSCLEFLTCLFFLTDWKPEDQIKHFLPQLFLAMEFITALECNLGPETWWMRTREKKLRPKRLAVRTSGMWRGWDVTGSSPELSLPGVRNSLSTSVPELASVTNQ